VGTTWYHSVHHIACHAVHDTEVVVQRTAVWTIVLEKDIHRAEIEVPILGDEGLKGRHETLTAAGQRGVLAKPVVETVTERRVTVRIWEMAGLSVYFELAAEGNVLVHMIN
jgi:hypothetical protein